MAMTLEENEKEKEKLSISRSKRGLKVNRLLFHRCASNLITYVGFHELEASQTYRK